MTDIDSTPQEALELLMGIIRYRNSELAQHLQEVIDLGVDEITEEPSDKKKSKPNKYRKKRPHTHREALLIVASAIESILIERPLIASAIETELKACALSTGSKPNPKDEELATSAYNGINTNKIWEFEVQTETKIDKDGDANFRIELLTNEAIEEQERCMAEFKRLINFEG